VTHNPQALFVSWQSQENRAIYPIARLLHLEQMPHYEFTYVRGVVDAEKHGFTPFRELPDTRQVYWFDELPPLFTNRLMPRSRPDFREHIARLGLGHDVDLLAPELILARSEGRKVTDHLEITASPEFDQATKTWVYFGFARGVRHVEGAEAAVREVRVGDSLRIERDLTNAWDARALFVLRSDAACLGFVPHILVEDLGGLMERGVAVRAEVARVNLPPAPIHQRLLVKFSAAHRAGFAPMSTTRFEPLAPGARRVILASAADLNPA
jgi:hypothetical protein